MFGGPSQLRISNFYDLQKEESRELVIKVGGGRRD